MQPRRPSRVPSPHRARRASAGDAAAPRVALGNVRDSKDPSGPALAVRPAGWTAFVEAVRVGGFRA
ncbi:DUF397 domain-containing protein [Micromonospora olivasterospora]|uniref:Uncharacterized protein DUF397 n=1 Tax=Micromonospora olivasterospora TaxID=1880 RepID=A0A562I8C6_MICOL|nr:DUF397 domain-containing protein [Micromonospora olivasterospora]TWH66933.1 uncharacterized protein DUF397 [Micromonospora olivasterospora]